MTSHSVIICSKTTSQVTDRKPMIAIIIRCGIQFAVPDGIGLQVPAKSILVLRFAISEDAPGSQVDDHAVAQTNR